MKFHPNSLFLLNRSKQPCKKAYAYFFEWICKMSLWRLDLEIQKVWVILMTSSINPSLNVPKKRKLRPRLNESTKNRFPSFFLHIDIKSKGFVEGLSQKAIGRSGNWQKVKNKNSDSIPQFWSKFFI